VKAPKTFRLTPRSSESAAPPTSLEDPELHAVAAYLRSRDTDGSRFAEVLRNTYEQLFDGQRTGRFSTDVLLKTEKTHMGTLVEINLQREFEFPGGEQMDYKIEGVEVDCKFSQDLGGWEIPPEAYDPLERFSTNPRSPIPAEAIAAYELTGPNAAHLCLVVWANDPASRWEAGLVRAQVGNLRRRPDGSLVRNRDNKVKLSADGEARILWLWATPRLPDNLLLGLQPSVREEILGARSGVRVSGQARINMLFRRVQGRLIRRAVVLTVGQQDDALKRARDARLGRHLGDEGILVLGHQEGDPEVAEALELPRPRKGEFISIRVVRAEADFVGPTAEINGDRWRAASSDDAMAPAPQMHRSGRTGMS
jgi:hypothetical protein